ncbi:transposase [Ochrobactrum sp. RH2CCR150]|nr:transposase [Ochrobactrum sp. RH2CCR150]
MTDVRQPICLRRSGLGRYYWQIALTTTTACAKVSKNEEHGGCIRPMPNRVNIPAFSPWFYKQRNAVERFFNKLKHFRAIATRYDKRGDNFLASIQLASIRISL